MLYHKTIMKGCRPLLAAAVALLLLIGCVCVPVLASDGAADYGYAENPLFQYHTDFDSELLATFSEEAPTFFSLPEQAQEGSGEANQTTAAQYVSFAAAACMLRDAMEQRQTVLTLNIQNDGKPDINALRDAACSMENAVTPTTGDYLTWSWSKMRWERTETSAGSGQWTCTIYIAYYDTAQEEAAFRTALSALVEELDLWRLSDYARYKAINEYVATHVTYDYAGQATHDDDGWGYDEEYHVYTYTDPNGDSDWLIYTAYDALVNGKSVCQGYSTLMYALCRAYGLDVRIQDGSNHSWNIVRLGSLWYYADATWDSLYGTGKYFLMGSADFADHYPRTVYQTEAYQKAQPLSEAVYLPSQTEQAPFAFWDVVRSDYYFDAVRTLFYREITKGVSKTTFAPDGAMTRGMVVTLLYRLAGEPPATQAPFTDVPADAYYASAVNWAAERGITTGTSATSFSPEAAVTRQELAAFLYRYALAMSCDTANDETLSGYADAGEVEAYAVPAMKWAVSREIVLGTEPDSLSPREGGTRGQIAAMLYRFLLAYQL